MRICAELEIKYEEKRLALLVAEVKLMTEQASAGVQIAKMRKELAVMQYQINMGERHGFSKANIRDAHSLRSDKEVVMAVIGEVCDKGATKIPHEKLKIDRLDTADKQY